jgi:hypothetical protein
MSSLSDLNLPEGFGSAHPSSRELNNYRRVSLEGMPTYVTATRPQRFNGKGELTAIAGVPVNGHAISDDNEVESYDLNETYDD